jgi:hypothetical protein
MNFCSYSTKDRGGMECGKSVEDRNRGSRIEGSGIKIIADERNMW